MGSCLLGCTGGIGVRSLRRRILGISGGLGGGVLGGLFRGEYMRSGSLGCWDLGVVVVWEGGGSALRAFLAVGR
jgi:hypothetical protein